MSENYLTVIERRLRELFAQVSDGTQTVDNAVAFLKDELLASYKRGRTSATEARRNGRRETRGAFFYAGARSLLVSHWVVDDDATAELMSRTFANAARNPSRRQAEALQEAMLSIMNDPGHPEWADPGFWAPFVMVGEARRGN